MLRTDPALVDSDVVVVGSGPNGLAAAVVAARAGLSVRVVEAQPTLGGGARTVDLGLADGVVHDLCSAVHPLALASPFFAAFDLRARGVRLLHPEVAYAHPLDGRPAGLAYRDLDRTVSELGADGRAWRSLLGPLAAQMDMVVALALGDQRSVPAGLVSTRGAVVATRFAAGLLEQGGPAWGHRFSGQVAPALLTGVAAHSITPLPSLAAAGTALLLASLAHAGGWPIPEGGSQAIVNAMAADVQDFGGSIQVGWEVRRWQDLPPARAYLFDTAPRGLVGILGDRLPARYRRALGRFRYGNAAAKVDFVLSGPVPWADPRIAGAGTVHLGGTRAQMVLAEGQVAAGRHADHPVVLCSQPATVDPTRRGAAGEVPLWTYAHVPAGSDVDVTEVVVSQIERFAPGFRDLVLAARCVPAAQLGAHNQNYVGGAVTMFQMIARPTPRWNPYRTPVDGVYLCSSSTPPGPGVHGMGGLYAARRMLREVFGIHEVPTLGPR